MNKRKAWVIAGISTVMAVVAVGVVIYFAQPRQGINDFCPNDPQPIDARLYVGWLAHSQTEYENGVLQMTAWHIQRTPDGRIVRMHVATIPAWYRILDKNGGKVVRLPDAYMNQHMPEEGEVS